MSCLEPLPAGWQFITVEEIATEFRYGTSAKTSAENKGVPVLRMGNISSLGEINFDDLKYLPVGHPDLAETMLQEGDLLFNRTNSFELVGKSAVYSGLPTPCSFASYLIRVRLGPRCSPKYLAFALNSHIGRTWIKGVVSQQVGQANVNGTKLRSFRFPLPPIDEQRRIVGEIEKQFTRIDAAVSGLCTVEAKLRRFCAKVLERAAAGKPGWATRKLGDLASEIRNGIAAKPTEAEGLPILRISSVRPMKVNYDQVRFLPKSTKHEYERYLLRAGDLLFTRYNGNPEFVGVAGVLRTEEQLVYPDKLIRLRLPDDSPVSPDFLEIAVNSGQSRKFLRSRVRTTAGQAGISGADIKACPVAFPPSHTQQAELVQEVQRALTQANATAATVATNIRRAERLRSGILKLAFEGHLVVQEKGVIHA
ncbi:MAG TPA: restriction endonuclease subunit S [Bryobacteraceae bacterium]|nr:restriction endonuclease subunit S [Bryobacteraceae bacterium]